METSDKTIKKLKRIKRAARGAEVPTHADPRQELRLLVTRHKAVQLTRVRLENASATRVAKKDIPARGIKAGDKIPTPLPASVVEINAQHCKALKAEEARLKREMLAQLKTVPIYSQWLRHVYGFGEVACAYLLSDVDIAKCEKPSSLRRFCGLAVINGRLERRARGVRSAYNSALRVKLYSAFVAMVKNGAKGAHSKYLRIWADAMHRKLSAPDTRPVNEGGWRPSLARAARAYGWHKAADVFVEDLYTVWRSIEGLPVWPSYYAAKLGYEHGGKISVNAPRMLTVEEAIEMVGHVGSVPGKLDSLYRAKDDGSTTDRGDDDDGEDVDPDDMVGEDDINIAAE